MSNDFEDEDIEGYELYNPEFYKLRIKALKYCYEKYISITITDYNGNSFTGKIKQYTDDEYIIVIPVNEKLDEYKIKTLPVSEIRYTEYIDIGADKISTLIDDFNQK